MITCKCGEELTEIKGKYGFIYRCSAYPLCQNEYSEEELTMLSLEAKRYFFIAGVPHEGKDGRWIKYDEFKLYENALWKIAQRIVDTGGCGGCPKNRADCDGECPSCVNIVKYFLSDTLN
jgi:ssDNA-binding Zn-finger/Zn-ribbon topoisomerase 1